MRSYLFIVLLSLTVAVNAQEPVKSSKRAESVDYSEYQMMLDSAMVNKNSDIDRSLDFITRALASLPDQGSEKERAAALSALGEIYEYHRQFDLAIASYEDALALYKTTRTAILLGRTLVKTNAYEEAQAVLLPLLDIKGVVPYQRIELYEYLGDTYAGLMNTNTAVDYYEEGLKIARKNRISPKIPDLNSKIADVYASVNRSQEAEAYYGYSLEQAEEQAPARAVREKEKVADFYNKENRFDDEIDLRKKSLSELRAIQAPAGAASEPLEGRDTITTQQINYKIANAYLAQDKDDEAIPFLVESIKEADVDDDLEVKKEATRTLSEVYRDRGDFTKALETYQQYVAVVDTLYAKKEAEISQAASFSREIANKQNRINSLERDRELSQSKYELAIAQQQLAEETNRRQKWVIYSLVILSALGALTAFFFYRSNRQQKLANNLLALKSLRTQMNPHFIFNALNSVNSYIARKDERSANKYLSEFSSLMRSVLENSDKDFIPLSRELELIEIYLKLEHSRFPEKFDYSIEKSEVPDLNDYQIPPMLLQPYVENAVWHGLRYKEGKGYLNISIEKKSSDSILVTIEDNGIGRKRSKELKTSHQKDRESRGMGNIEKRIAILNSMYKDKIDVKIEDLNDDGSGTRVSLTLYKRK